MFRINTLKFAKWIQRVTLKIDEVLPQVAHIRADLYTNDDNNPHLSKFIKQKKK